MKKLMIFLVLILFSLITQGVSATSWAEMDPDEVMERAEVVVIGQYDFSKPQKQKVQQIFLPYQFKAANTLYGSPPSPLIVGIDMYDVGWAEEFQNEGGEFLLFLERDGNSNFLLPVGGPNGMVQLVDGKVSDQGERALYEKISKKTNVNIETKSLEQDSNSNSYTFLYMAAALMVVLVGAYVLYRFKNDRRDS